MNDTHNDNAHNSLEAGDTCSSSDPVGVATEAVLNAATDLTPDDVHVYVTPDTPWGSGSDVTVRATYPYQINILGLVVASGDLHSETTERVE